MAQRFKSDDQSSVPSTCTKQLTTLALQTYTQCPYTLKIDKLQKQNDIVQIQRANKFFDLVETLD